MKKVTAFVGTASKKSTHHAVRRFLDDLQSLGGVECEVVALSDYRIGTCKGCKACFLKGEESCPLKDDRDVLIEKMMTSDGVVFATPNHSFQVSALLKTFLDRLGFAFHRPRFFGKTFTSIVTQGFFGGGKIERYLDFVGNGLGFNTVRGTVLTTLEPMTEKQERQNARALARLSRRVHERLLQPAFPRPTLFKLMGFRMARTSMGLLLAEGDRDRRYYSEKGWFEADYYYPTRLGFLKKAAGRLFDAIFAHVYARHLSTPGSGGSVKAAARGLAVQLHGVLPQ